MIRLESVVARYCVSLGKRFDGLDLGENAHEKLSLSIDPCPKKHVRLHVPQGSLKPLCFTVRCLTQHCWRVRSQTYLSIQTTETTQTTQWLSNSETTQGSQTTQRFSNLTIQTTQGSQTTQTTQTTQTILTIQTIQTITSANTAQTSQISQTKGMSLKNPKTQSIHHSWSGCCWKAPGLLEPF